MCVCVCDGDKKCTTTEPKYLRQYLVNDSVESLASQSSQKEESLTLVYFLFVYVLYSRLLFLPYVSMSLSSIAFFVSLLSSPINRATTVSQCRYTVNVARFRSS